jgi:hypothetical protein
MGVYNVCKAETELKVIVFIIRDYKYFSTVAVGTVSK